MIPSHKADHENRGQNCNRDRRNGMGIKNLQKFDIRRNDRDQVSLVTPFQFCRTEPPQGRKNFVADHCQQFERNKMIAVLLRIMENAPHHCKQNQPKKQPPGKCSASCHLHNGLRRCNGQENRTQIADGSEQNGRQHNVEHGFYQTNELTHDLNTASSFLCTAHKSASFVYASSFLWLSYSS